MGYTPVELALVKGLPSSASLGNPALTDYVPTTIDFLTGAYVLYDDGSNPAYDRALPVIKNGGVWVDSATATGRQLVAAHNGNVIDVVQLRPVDSTSSIQRDQYISRLNRFIGAASEFWATGGISDPVYLRYKELFAPGEQYALIYTIEPDDDGDTLTLTIEREPAWRPLPPGMNPKVWALLRRGLQPWAAASPPTTGFFNFADLSLVNAGASGKGHLLEATCKRVDEVATANVNYVIVPAADIPGDAPALCWIHASSLAASVSKIYLSRSTWRDYFPTINTNVLNQKLRNTFNGGDSTLVGGGGLTASKQVDATYGLFSNGSTVTRYILRAANLAAGFGETTWATWTRTINHYTRRWAAFARIRVTSGTAANHSLRLGMKVITKSVYTSPRSLAGVTSTPSLFYIGELDASQFTIRTRDGFGVDITYGATLSALLTKTNDGVASTVEIMDIILLPLDEPSMKIDGVESSNASSDSTGYFSLTSKPYGLTNGAFERASAQGQEITLKPDVDNRIYFLDDYVGANYQTGTITIYVDVLPRWYGVRDV